jgi:HD-GYP domain-containing protein (c-di-GMP phosphodiesterase class II)
MPSHAFTREGVLLLARGKPLVSPAQLDRLFRPDVVLGETPPPRRPKPSPEKPSGFGNTFLQRPPLEDLEEAFADLSTSQPPPEPESRAASPRRAPARPLPPRPVVPFAQEVVAARRLRASAMRQVSRMIEAVEQGRPLDLGEAEATVQEILASLERNERAFASLLRLKSLDQYTFTHSVNCCLLATLVARQRGLGDRTREIGLGALLHDIGKVRLPVALLRKTESLTPEEWGLVYRHPTLGVETIQAASSPAGPCSLVAIDQHHERLDGSGYPGQRSGDNVGLDGRLVAIADVYDAMTSDRPYRPALQPAEVMHWLYREAGRLFDAQLVADLIAAIGLFPVGTLVRLAGGELAIVAKVNPLFPLRPVVLVISDRAGGPLVKPPLLDLSRPSTGDDHKIAGVESPLAHQVDIDALLSQVTEESLLALEADSLDLASLRLDRFA